MKHPLTSKERRGLAAVAAAALLCIAAGPMLRHCTSMMTSGAGATRMSATSGRDAADAPSGSLNPGLSKDSVGTGKKKEGKGKAERRKKSSKKKKSGRQPKVYPEREPLDQEIDHR